MRLWKRESISWDDLKRLQTRLDECLSELRDLQAQHGAMQVEWEDVVSQVRRSYQRLEAAEKRSEQRERGAPAPQPELDLSGRQDPFSKKLAEIRGAGYAVPSGADQGAG